MSLFSSREWWHTSLGSGEEFDQGSLCIANIDNDPHGTVKVVTGSLQGVLRVHQPHQRGYHIEDVLLEAELGSSILQLAAGNFLQGPSLCLAVLHPRTLAMFSLQAVGSSYLQLSKVFEHQLEHTAANMAYGPFGGVTGVDHIVVQSYDGQLCFFEQEVPSFSRCLPGFLLPGPLAYVPASDSFVTSTAGLELVAYTHSAIAAAASLAPGGGGQHGASPDGKRIQEDWKVVLGELALDIRTGNLAAAADAADAPCPSLLVLGEHTFFILDLLGHILVQRRLDHPPAACWAFPAGGASSSSSGGGGNEGSSRGGGPADNLLIATHSKALLVFRGPQLAWAAQLELLPVAVRVTSIGGVPGMVVALEDAGRLSVLYLGTEPPKQSVAFSEARPLDYAAMEEERRGLLVQLQQAGGAAGLDAAVAAKADAAATSKGVPPLLLRAKVPSRCDAAEAMAGSISGAFGGGLGSWQQQQQQQQKQLTVTLLLSNTTKAPLQDVAISVLAPHPLEVLEEQLPVMLPELPAASRDSQPAAVQLVLQAPATSTSSSTSSSSERSISLPSANTAQVVVTYKAVGGQTGAAHLSITLPMCLFCQVVPPLKSADFRVTVSTNREAVQLADVFADMLAQANPQHAEALSRSQAANVLSFLFPGGQEASILVSKHGGRYRLQGSTFEALWLVLAELSRRLAEHGAAAAKKPQPAGAGAAQQPPAPFAITCDGALPLQELFGLVDQHFAARQALASIDAALEQQEVAFRSIQKRLLVRCKDKNAAPLNELDVLMEETYEHIIALADQMEAAQDQLAASAQSLGAGVQLLLLLAKFRFGLSEQDAQALASCLSHEVHEGPEVSWEELTEAAMTQLLRTSLARGPRDAAADVPPLAPAARDTARLKRHVALVLERHEKGMRIVTAAALKQ